MCTSLNAIEMSHAAVCVLSIHLGSGFQQCPCIGVCWHAMLRCYMAVESQRPGGSCSVGTQHGLISKLMPWCVCAYTPVHRCVIGIPFVGAMDHCASEGAS